MFHTTVKAILYMSRICLKSSLFNTNRLGREAYISIPTMDKESLKANEQGRAVQFHNITSKASASKRGGHSFSYFEDFPSPHFIDFGVNANTTQGCNH